MRQTKHKKTAAIHTLGCKVNQVESSQIAYQLNQLGFDVKFGLCGSPIDLAIVNTCVVTQKAEAESRRSLMRMGRSGNMTIATGCMAQICNQEVSEMEGVDHVFTNQQKNLLIPFVRSLENENGDGTGQFTISPCPTRLEELSPGYLNTKTRAFLKIQDGCTAFCSYCIVPYGRGPSRSMPPERVFGQFRYLAESGFREIVLTGVNLGQYGYDLTPPITFTDLLSTMIEEPFDVRIRLSSLDPTEITSHLTTMISESEKICPHLHLPLQSGDSEILHMMNRRYSSSDYIRVVEELASAVPDIAIGSDVLVGFPGESEQAFVHTKQVIERLPISHLHVFPYSSRDGTPAAKLPHHVPHQEKRRRAAIIRDLGLVKKRAFYSSMIGSWASVLVHDGPDSTGHMRGLSERYIPVLIKGHRGLINHIIPVRLTKVIDTPKGLSMKGKPESSMISTC